VALSVSDKSARNACSNPILLKNNLFNCLMAPVFGEAFNTKSYQNACTATGKAAELWAIFRSLHLSRLMNEST
jgi:hypothetical protein